ncbi:MAG: ATP synthase F1 subunit delta [Bdellovibrionales bacterium]
MSQAVLAKRYAKSLYELGHQRKMASAYHAQLAEAASAINKDSVVKQFFVGTAASKVEKKEILKKLFAQTKLESDIQAFLYLLIDKARFSLLEEIVKASQELSDADQGTTRGLLFSAQPIAEAHKLEYEKKASSILGKKIQLETRVQAGLVGGVKIEVAGWTFDDSLSAHLDKISERMLGATV